MLHVFGSIFACYQDVIDVAVAEVQASQDLSNKLLKCLCSVLETEQHPGKLIQFEWCSDGGFGDVLVSHRNLVICPCLYGPTDASNIVAN